METDLLADNAAMIESEIAWFRDILELRLRLHSGESSGPSPFEQIRPPAIAQARGPYADMVRAFDMGSAERLVLMLGYLPHIRPEILDPLLIQNQSVHRRFTEFGDKLGKSHGGLLQTGETALFLLAGSDTRARMQLHALFGEDHYF